MQISGEMTGDEVAATAGPGCVGEDRFLVAAFVLGERAARMKVTTGWWCRRRRYVPLQNDPLLLRFARYRHSRDKCLGIGVMRRFDDGI